MKIPLSWLKDYTSINLPPAQLVDRLTIAGLEVAGVRILGLPIPDGLRIKAEERGPIWDRDKVLVGEIVSVERHPNADKLTLPTVKYGEGRSQRLVTGAGNVKVGEHGQKVVVALLGAKLFDGHSDVPVIKELKPSKIRGVPSEGMVCSYQELGVTTDAKLNEGIVFLEAEAKIGTPLADLMGDIVLEVDVLPNMARCLSMLGVAREVAALTGESLRLPPAPAAPTGASIVGKIEVQIEDANLCPRYAAGLITDVQHGDAPGWMQRLLLYAGMRPISNLVDITNYVMLEWGQPLHAFDYDLLVERTGGKTPTIIIRPARAGEILVTLDGQRRELTPEHLVIADTRGPIALAGVMGGLETEVTTKTRRILLESANFDFVSIRRTMKHFNLPSEASVRFSKGIHPDLVPMALERAADLMRQFAGGTVAQGIVDRYPAPKPPQIVELSMKKVSKILGMEFSQNDAERILTTLEFEVRKLDADRLQAVVPSHRLDIQEGEADLIEELVRIHGYDRLPSTLPADRLPPQENNRPLIFEDRIRDLLVRAGLQEIISYALTMPRQEAVLLGSDLSKTLDAVKDPTQESPLGDEVPYVRLLNPISSERTVMRRSVLASALEATASNLRHESDVRLFELGFVYQPKPGEKLPDEPRRLSLVMVGKRRGEFWDDTSTAQPKAPDLDFFDLKGILELLTADLHLANVTYRPAKAGYLHPGRSAEILAGDQLLGSFGQLHPKAAEFYQLGAYSVLVADLDVEALQAASPERFSYSPVPRFPAALRDIALVVEETVTNERILAEIRAAGGALLGQTRLFDVYRGDSIQAGTKSLAYALAYQAEDRTLTDKEVDKAHKKIEDRLKHVLKAQIRGKD